MRKLGALLAIAGTCVASDTYTAAERRHWAFQPRAQVGSSPALIPLRQLDDEAFRERFRHSPIKRAKRRGLLRNVCVALGNIGDPVAVHRAQTGQGFQNQHV